MELKPQIAWFGKTTRTEYPDKLPGLVVQGHHDVYYIGHAPLCLSPPLESITLPEHIAVQDVRSAASPEVIYFFNYLEINSPFARPYPIRLNVKTGQSFVYQGYIQPADDCVDICTNDAGYLLASDIESTILFAPDGHRIFRKPTALEYEIEPKPKFKFTGKNFGVMKEPIRLDKYFERPVTGIPFWEESPTLVSGNEDSFIVGGLHMGKIDHYRLDGRLIKTINSFSFQGRDYKFQQGGTSPWDIVLDASGRIWVHSSKFLCCFGPDGRQLFVESYEDLWRRVQLPPDGALKHRDVSGFEEIFVDKNGLMWANWTAGDVQIETIESSSPDRFGSYSATYPYSGIIAYDFGLGG